MTVSEVARAKGCSEATVIRHDSTLRPVRTRGGMRLYDPSVVYAWIDAGRRRSGVAAVHPGAISTLDGVPSGGRR